ncbi:MAG TPA: alanine--tRNA ligase [Clostridiaceae bacterium]|jgi:alanyl-tRNA synthetase|nr:alanine--tRNA ligase [Clostridiaceae bacterium]
MQETGLNELREKFLSFFESKQHLRLKSFSLIPKNDKSLLLINSGMAPLKPYFTGAAEPPSRRVTTCQKCIRTPDIENVGKTARHGTFFEMLGNFSFGDYFKKEAISWAWEFVTKVIKMPEDRLYVSIYKDDDEAFEIWNKDIGLSEDRIVRMGKEDNFWEHGTGPCGPCSEIYFDRGVEYGCGSPDCKVGCDCDRYVEFWNLVFTQFDRHEDGSYTRLDHPNIDTGMGLERLAAIMQNVNNLFEVNTVRNILKHVCKISGVEYGKSHKDDVSIRVITDHIRSTTMMIADGILPSNEGRGYVLRRLLRRAARHGKLLGIDEPFLYKIALTVINESKEAYPELAENSSYIQKVIRNEEEKFEVTIDQGLSILNDFIKETKAKELSAIPGEMVFKLHDTYGFPLDLTREIAEENNLGIDEAGFKSEMEKQKNKAREAMKSRDNSAWGQGAFSGLEGGSTEFTGYRTLSDEGEILYIIKDGNLNEIAEEGDEATIVLDRTPFYAESGGQVGDTGYIFSENGKFRVEDCKKTGDGKHLHIGVVESGYVKKGDMVNTNVDEDRRISIQRNHTATHLLHKALKNVLGTHVNQAGSLVTPDRLRFDFTHFEPVSKEDLGRIENEVNEKMLSSLSVNINEMTVDEAKNMGATALFDEKYGDTVRVVKIGDYSMELCGGTHLKTTSQAGFFKIISETGVAAGVRRIEALTGFKALEYFHEREKMLEEVSDALKSSSSDCVKKAETLSAELKNARKEIEQLRAKLAGSTTDDIISRAVKVKGVKVVRAKYDGMDMDTLRKTADILKNKLGSGVVVLATTDDKKVNFVVTATYDVVKKGIHSGNIIAQVAKIAGGGGGGRPDMAQAGGRDVTKTDEALEKSLEIIDSQIKN